MQAMPDKELDRLFKQRLDSLETEPSSALWSKISADLDTDKKRKTTPVWWMAAASVVLILGAGLFLFNPAAEDQPEQKPATEIAVEKQSEVVIDKIESAASTEITSNTNQQQVALKTPAVKKAFTKPAADTKQKSKVQDVIVPQEYTARTIAPDNSKTVTSPDINLVKAVKKIDKEPETISHQPVISSLVAANQLNEEVVAKPKIKSLGALVNFVVSKVDHRKDKIIEFKDDDEGSQVSGINLGIVKFNNKNK